MLAILMFLIACIVTFISAVAPTDSNTDFPDCTVSPLSQSPICDTSLSQHDRVQQFLTTLSSDEKINLLITTSPMVPRLYIQPYEWWNEALHGLGYSPGVHYSTDTSSPLQYSTSYPLPLALSHSFNRTLIRHIGTAVSTEARMYSNGHRAGLHYFSPNINTVRDVRWGRAQETYGEDVYHAQQFTVAMVRALQGSDDNVTGQRYVKVGATCKHYAAYDMEDWGGVDRLHFDAQVNVLDLAETYLPVFKSCVMDGEAEAVMCSYNSINGVPSCANELLLGHILRKQWQFRGYVVSDCAAIDAIVDTHAYVNSTEQAVAVALKAGTDLDCDGQFYGHYMAQVLSLGLIDATDIDLAASRILRSLLRVGYFDSADGQPYRQIQPDTVDMAEHAELACDAARQSIVLLKNDKNVLPLQSKAVRRVALVGPLYDAADVQLGNYNGRPEHVVSIEEAVRARYGGNIELTVAHGCDTSLINEHTTFADVIAAVKNADVVIAVLGYGQDVASETLDRTSVLLPGQQTQLIDAIKSATVKPIVLVLMTGGGVDVSMYKHDAQISAMVYTQYLGQCGGTAVVDVLFDGVYSPSGRLTTTWYDELYMWSTSMFDMSFRPSETLHGRTYKFYKDAVYSFGYGLSYSTFAYSIGHLDLHSNYVVQLQVDASNTVSLAANPVVASLKFNVTNTGQYSSYHSVLGFIATTDAKECQQLHIQPPLKALFAYSNQYIHAGQTVETQLDLHLNELGVYSADGSRWLVHGMHMITIGVPEADHILQLQAKYDGKSVKIEPPPASW